MILKIGESAVSCDLDFAVGFSQIVVADPTLPEHNPRLNVE